ncbi:MULTISPECIES: carboxypeptidase-like regulatory domain-containing protein [Streptomyces]|uniref:carboxypeptidase-like regulatory domain-containing protein n=1 Tax=Streptomyces TaxID=1883 RepID=UPI002F93A878
MEGVTPEGGHAVRLVTGTVVDADGSPVAGAVVHLADGPGPVPDIAALTGPDGGFSFPVGAEGVYTVACRTADGRAARAAASVGPAGAPPVELRPE